MDYHQFNSVQSLSRVRLFVTPWIAARQASLSITISGSLLRFMFLESVMVSNLAVHFSSCLHSFPASGSFPMSQIFASGGQSIWVSASASALPMNIQVWFPLGLTSFSSVQFSSVAQSCPTLCNPMNRSTPGLLVHHQLLEFTQTHVHWVGDAIQPSHPLLSLSPPVFNLSQNQGL